jgi:tyrosinase
MRGVSQGLIAAVVFSFVLPLGAQPAPARPRRNIECLSADEVATYRHAIDVLKKRDPAKDNPSDPLHNSYQWYVALHNGDGVVSNCNHQNELFLPWHRALLLVFEHALQESDPDHGTRSIMLPYWNWAVDPTGLRYPKVFEVKGDVLYATRSTKQPDRRLYSEAQLENVIQTSTNWRMFGGSPCSDPDCPGSAFGTFEQPFHNRMHMWIGGAMQSDTTAAVDPLFWSFHDYIDLVFARWQLAHPGQVLGCPDCKLRGMPEWTPRNVTRTEDLGYVYDMTTCPAPTFRTTALGMPKAAIELVKPKKSMAAGPVIVDVTIPQPDFTTAEVEIQGAEVPSTFSYRGAVYLYPAETALAPHDASFSRRYRLGDYSVWALHHGNHRQHHEAVLYVDATTELRYLAKKYPGAAWKLAVVLDDVQLTDTTSNVVPLSVRSEVRFDEVSFVFDRGKQ